MAPLDAFLKAAEPALGGQDFGAFAALGPYFAASVDPRQLAQRCEAQLRAHLERPTRTLPEADAERWILERSGDATLSVELLPRAPRERHLNGSASHRLLLGLVGEPRFALWRHPSAAPAEVFDRSLRLESRGERSLRAGEWLALEAWRDVSAPCPGRAVVVVLESAPVHPVAWSYDSTGTPLLLSAADPQFSQLDHALRVLLLLGHPEGAARSADLARHPFHALRWTAIRAACGFDEATGHRLLREALDDPHPQVSAAAARALAALEASWPSP